MFLKYRGSQEHMDPPGPHSTPQAGCTKAAEGQQINAQAFCGSRPFAQGGSGEQQRGRALPKRPCGAPAPPTALFPQGTGSP